MGSNRYKAEEMRDAVDPEKIRARGYKTFMLNSVENEIFPANKY